MATRVRLVTVKPPRESVALALVGILGVAAVVAVYATWRFAKLVP